MEVILLQRIGSLGTIGSVVNVKAGFARNYLLPQKKALRATEANKIIFEDKRAEIEANNELAKSTANTTGESLVGKVFVFINQASDTGVLYGSVNAKNIAEIITHKDLEIKKHQIILNKPLKSLGLHDIQIALHPDVIINVQVNIARTEDEAVRQEKGENVLVEKDDEDEKKSKSSHKKDKGKDTQYDASDESDNKELSTSEEISKVSSEKTSSEAEDK